MIPLLGVIIGILIGIFLPFNVPDGLTVYVAVGILAALDTVFGGAVADLRGRFDIRVFITGFLGNMLLALLLTFIGEKLGLSLYLVPMFAFGVRMFNNFAKLRRLFFSKYIKKDQDDGQKESRES